MDGLKKSAWTTSFFILLATGCYSYQAPEYSAAAGVIYSPDDYIESQKILALDPVLTLDKALKVALINNPTLISATHSANAARFNYYSSIGAFAPSINAGVSVQNQPNKYGKLINPIPDSSKHERHFLFDSSIELSWLIFDGLARELKMLATESQAQNQEELTKDASHKLSYAVAVAYYDVLLATESEKIYQSDIDFQNINLEYSIKQQSAGFSDSSQVLNFRILKSRAESRLRTAQYQKQIAMLSLAMLMGYPSGTLPRDVIFPEINPQPPKYRYSIDECLMLAHRQRPDYQAGLAAMEALKYMKYAQYSSYSPTINFVAGAAYQTDRGRYDSPSLPRDSQLYGGEFYYGFEGSWKLFDGFTRYNLVRQAQALYAASEFDMAQMYLQIINQVRQAYADYENNLDQCIIYSEMLDWTDSQRRLVRTEYIAGNIIVTRLNEAQNDLVRARYDYLISMINLYKSVAKLNMAIGKDNE